MENGNSLGGYVVTMLLVALITGLAIMAMGSQEGYIRADTGACVGVLEKSGKVRACRQGDRYQAVTVAPGMSLKQLQMMYGK